MGEILFVEDNEQIRSLFARGLRAAGHAVIDVALAEQALDVLRTRTPDVVVLDLGMPAGEMQGIELLARMRETPAWAETPVVILSGLGDVVDEDVIRRLRVAAIFTKPRVTESDLIAAIGRILEGRAP
jgi:CheY-like chemotaxis protein